MNIKIKSSGVYCLVGEDYDRVFAVLRSQFKETSAMLFTERMPGHEYLQWELPGDGWVSLAEGDPLMGQEVRNLLHERMRLVRDRFGTNQDMANRVLSVPDEDYIFFKAAPDGSVMIRLTAWGYRYPERIEGAEASGAIPPKTESEHVLVRSVYDGKPFPGYSLKLNGFHRVTDSQGNLDIGDLPLGYQLDVDAGSTHTHLTVAPGEGEIILDVTEYSLLDVYVTVDDAPCAGVEVHVQYLDRDLRLSTDGAGHVCAKLPVALAGDLCTVTVESETQQHALSGEMTPFRFSLSSPALAKEPDSEIPQEAPPVPSEDSKSVPEPGPQPEPAHQPLGESESGKDPSTDTVSGSGLAPELGQESEQVSEPYPEPEANQKYRPGITPDSFNESWKTMPLPWCLLILFIFILLVALTYYISLGLLFG